MLAGHQAEVGNDAGAGEALPVADLDRQRETVNVEMPRRQARRRASAVNSVSPAIAVIFSSSRSRRALASSTVSYASSKAACVAGASKR